ncbi:MAG: hypothetical protein WC607_03065 [Candidatus Micrarchaeia archaeon]
MKPVKVVLSPEAEEAYNYLNEKAPTSKIERSILNAVNKKKELIKANIHYGEAIAKSKIPEEYVRKYGVNNLFWVGLPDGWRMLYTLTANGEIKIIAFVLDILDHRKYDKKFKYK